MSEHFIKVDDRQLQIVTELLRPPAAPAANRFDMDRAAKLVTVLAMLSAGVWVLFEYFDFRKQQQQLATEAQRLTVRQQQFEVESQQVEKEKRELSNKILEKELALKGIDFSEQSQRKLDARSRLSLAKLPPATQPALPTYRATYGVTFKNNSKTNVEVTYVVMRCYLGEPSPQDAGAPGMTMVNGCERDAPEGSFLAWKRVAGMPHVYGDHLQSPTFANMFQMGIPPRPEGGTARLAPGEESYISNDFIIRGTPEHWVGFRVDAGIDGGKNAEDRLVIDKWVALAEASDPARNPAAAAAAQQQQQQQQLSGTP